MQIGNYEVVAEVGHGGMGIVYKAVDLENGNPVAIKMLTGMGAIHPDARMRLVREARTAGQLAHPNIVRTYDIGQHKGWLYIVMEYLEGCSLDRIIKVQAPIPLEYKLHLIISLCNGLSYAHSKGVVHRDIKPANTFVLKSGSAKIVDFGIANLAEMTGTVSTKTQIAGTWLYMSPEQLNGVPVDSRSDLWSVGVTLYELLTYKLPFSASTIPEIARRICGDPTPRLDAAAMGIPDQPAALAFLPKLNVVLERALAKKREARYATADALATDLADVAMGIAFVEGRLQEILARGGLDLQEILAGKEWEKFPSRTTLFDNAARRDAPSYSVPNLGFRQQNRGKVSFRQTKFSDSGLLLRTRQYLHQQIVFGQLWLVYGVCLLAIAMLTFTRSGRISSLAALVTLLSVSISGASLIGGLYTVSRFTIRPRCRTCRRKMFSCSKWKRFLNSKTAVMIGYGDCITALQKGHFEDAAKLLTVHGTQNAEIYGVTRYTLECWECRVCGDHSALLTVEAFDNLKWKRIDDYTESYKSASSLQENAPPGPTRSASSREEWVAGAADSTQSSLSGSPFSDTK
jgi:serine/threonine protein kinase